MKNRIVLLLLGVLLLTLTGCGKKAVAVSQESLAKPVKVIEAKLETTDVTLDYIGVVDMSQTTSLAFKSSGKLNRLHVDKGQEVKAGMVLAELEKKELSLALDAANAQLASAQAQYSKAVSGATPEDVNKAQLNVDKAQKAYDFASDNLARLEQLYKSGTVSKSEFEQAKLETNIREADLKQAQEVLNQVTSGARAEDKKALAAQVDQAKANCELRATLLEDADLATNVDGYVLDILFEEGELVGTGYPVIVIGSHAQLVTAGVTGEDFNKISVKTPVIVRSNESETTGTVTYLSIIPDRHTRTYEAEITLNNSHYALGDIVNISFVIGKQEGIWIPVTAILSEGEDFVFLVKDNMAVKTKVIIREVRGTKVMVEGINDKDLLVTEGLHRLLDGDSLHVQQ